MTPSIGSEISGLQLSKLSNVAKDQLALLIAQRKLLIFHDQDFADLPIQEAVDWAAYFGRPYIHLTSGSPENHPEIHLVHRGAGDSGAKAFMANRISSVGWHCDSSFEEHPPGTTMLYVLEHPKTGGDTLFVDQVQAYENLSPEFQKRLHGLKAIQYVSGEQFSSYLGMSKEEFLLRHYPLLFYLDISALKTCLGSNNSRSLPEEVIANSHLRIVRGRNRRSSVGIGKGL